MTPEVEDAWLMTLIILENAGKLKQASLYSLFWGPLQFLDVTFFLAS